MDKNYNMEKILGMDIITKLNDVPKMEHCILNKMIESKKNNNFSDECNRGKEIFRHYDGPPFATGKPHIGHIATGAIKDSICRWWRQNGYFVQNKIGYDCHGLPIENEIEKYFCRIIKRGPIIYDNDESEILNIGESIILQSIENTKLVLYNNRKGTIYNDIYTKKYNNNSVIMENIHEYTNDCKSIVFRCKDHWKKIIERIARNVDVDNSWSTMDKEYMETVWWVFNELYKKELVKQKYRVLPHSTVFGTPLSNHDIKDTYCSVEDPSVYVKFRLVNKENTFFLAWTTTPWTLPSNLLLCVNPNKEYSILHIIDINEKYILARKCIKFLVDKSIIPDEFIEEKVLYGKELVDWKYEPLFPLYQTSDNKGILKNAFKILSDDFVTTNDGTGTGVVHMAPAFGEDDMRVCMEHDIIADRELINFCPIDNFGKFTEDFIVSIVSDTETIKSIKGMKNKTADKYIINHLIKTNNILYHEIYVHEYPHCPRSKTPILNMLSHEWFFETEMIKDDIIENAKKTKWVSTYTRFEDWLMNLKSWNISRKRPFGTPVPIWMSMDGEKIKVIGSVKELREWSVKELDIDIDLHRNIIDNIELRDPRGDKYPPMKIIGASFDCWFESGCVPYASLHYPVENKDFFERSFPADFISEGLDQTRGWFYTLLVIGVALALDNDKYKTSLGNIKNVPPYWNVIVNGLVLAEDGKKMSKSLKNYPDVNEVIDQHGADSLRIYLLTSGLVTGKNISFSVNGVKEITGSIIKNLLNATKYAIQKYNSYCKRHDESLNIKDLNIEECHFSDKWIIAKLNEMIINVRKEMKKFRIDNAINYIIKLTNILCDEYIQKNRKRLTGKKGKDNWSSSIKTLLNVIHPLIIILSPFAPFITEYIYTFLKKDILTDDVPLYVSDNLIPTCTMTELEILKLEEIKNKFERKVNSVIEICYKIRQRYNLDVITPIRKMLIIADKQFLDDFYDDNCFGEYLIEQASINDSLKLIETKECSLLQPKLKLESLKKIIVKKFGNSNLKEYYDKIIQFGLDNFSDKMLSDGIFEFNDHDLLRLDDIDIQYSVKPEYVNNYLALYNGKDKPVRFGWWTTENERQHPLLSYLEPNIQLMDKPKYELEDILKKYLENKNKINTYLRKSEKTKRFKKESKNEIEYNGWVRENNELLRNYPYLDGFKIFNDQVSLFFENCHNIFKTFKDITVNQYSINCLTFIRNYNRNKHLEDSYDINEYKLNNSDDFYVLLSNDDSNDEEILNISLERKLRSKMNQIRKICGKQEDDHCFITIYCDNIKQVHYLEKSSELNETNNDFIYYVNEKVQYKDNCKYLCIDGCKEFELSKWNITFTINE